jgi:hypothetical protein
MARSGLAFPLPSSAGSQARLASAPPHFDLSSSGSSYRPSVHTPSSTSATPSRHTDPRQHLNSQRSVRNEQASGEETQHRARRTLNFPSSSGSRTQDSESIIAELCREISDLKKEARGKSPAKERPRKRHGKGDRENSEASLNARTEVWAETPSPTKKAPSSIHPSGTVQIAKEKSKHPNMSLSQRLGGNALPPKVQKKKG